MRANTFAGQVVAVLSRRASAFELDSAEPQTFPDRLRALLSRHRPTDTASLTPTGADKVTPIEKSQAEVPEAAEPLAAGYGIPLRQQVSEASVARRSVTPRQPVLRVPRGLGLSHPGDRTASRIGRRSRTGEPGSRHGDTPTVVALTTIFGFASLTVLIAALLYYFGWVQTRATFEYFGVDTSLLRFTTADYVLRSINFAIPPFTCFALVVLLLLGFHRRVVVRATAA